MDAAPSWLVTWPYLTSPDLASLFPPFTPPFFDDLLTCCRPQRKTRRAKGEWWPSVRGALAARAASCRAASSLETTSSFWSTLPSRSRWAITTLLFGPFFYLLEICRCCISGVCRLCALARHPKAWSQRQERQHRPPPRRPWLEGNKYAVFGELVPRKYRPQPGLWAAFAASPSQQPPLKNIFWHVLCRLQGLSLWV